MSNGDFDSDDFDLEGFDDGFNDDKTGKNSLGDLWRNNILVKIGVILFGLAVLVGIFSFFGGSKEKAINSSVGSGSTITEAPGGTEEMSENIVKATEDRNTIKMEEALRESESFVPMPTNVSKGQIPFQAEKEPEEDPLERWRRMQESKANNAAQKTLEPQEPAVDTKTPAIQAMSQAMSQQMQSILGEQELKGAKTKSIADLSYLEGLQEKERAKIEEAEKKREEELAQNNNADAINNNAILLPAGTIEYAQLIIEANTDVPGPILAQILTGPFKGGRIIGSFEQSYNYLTLNFNKIVLDGVDYTAQAVAIDPDTTLPGMATDINRRYMQRVVLPVAAEFVAGFANAISESGTTTITVTGNSTTETTTNSPKSNDQEVALGVARAGEELAGIIDEIKENNPQLIRVRAGTPMGILFVTAVKEKTEEEVKGPYEQIQNLNMLRGITDSENSDANSNDTTKP